MRRVTTLPLDIHLMIEHPEQQFEAFIEAGGDIINFHIEATAHADRLLRTIHAKNKRAGICINPGTPLSAIEDVLDVADQVMVMLINPGWGGQKMLPSALDKVRRLTGDARCARPQPRHRSRWRREGEQRRRLRRQPGRTSWSAARRSTTPRHRRRRICVCCARRSR